MATPRLHGRTEPNLDGKSTAFLVSTSKETADNGKGRKYYRTASRPTTEVVVYFTHPSFEPQLTMAMLALSYNGGAENVKRTKADRVQRRAVLQRIVKGERGRGLQSGENNVESKE